MLQDQLLSEILPNKAPLQIDESAKFEHFQNQIEPPSSEPSPPIENNYPQPSNSQATTSNSNFSSVFSSFSSILQRRPQSYTPKEEVVPPPAGIDALIGQGNDNVAPIPLFPTQVVPQSQPPPSAHGSANIFRRQGLKRPTYAPVPGLSNTVQISPPVPTVQPTFPPTVQSHPFTIQPPPAVQSVPAAIQPFPIVHPGPLNVQSSLPPSLLPPASIHSQSPVPSVQSLPPTVHPPPAPIKTNHSQPLSLQTPLSTVQSVPSATLAPSYTGQSHPPSVQTPPAINSLPPKVQPSPPVQSHPVSVLPPTVPQVQSHPLHFQPPPILQSVPPTTQAPKVQPHPLSVQPPPPTVQSHNFSAPPTVQSQFVTVQPPPTVQPFGNIPPTSTVQSHLTPASTFFDITPSAPPLASSTGLFSHNLPNQFKPISPLPSSVNAFSHIPQPHPTLPVQPVSQFLQPTYSLPTISSQSTLQSPVMAAIPASEALPNNNLDMAPALPDVYSTNNNVTDNTGPVNQIYRPVYHHWFFQKEIESKKIWQPFSMIDSLSLEQAFTSNDLDPDRVIATDGGRYDVNILRRQRTPVYWNGTPSEVRRCSWFHKGSPDGRLVPYEENVSARLEEEFKSAFELNQWHRKVELASRETVEFHGPDVLVVFPPTQSPDTWGNTPNQTRPRVVKRGMDEFDIDEGEPSHVDHILFLVHGIGSVCDLKFRTVEEVVDEFRNIALQLVQSHYRTSCEKGVVHRVEVLPISWHAKLHSDETGIDKQLKSITLESIPKLRDFTNDTLLDILFYTSPVYCQTIVSTVGNELNRIYDLFKERNPTFQGGVSLGGHSLGSLILFDLLCHQDSTPEHEEVAEEEVFPLNDESKQSELKRRLSRRISYMMGSVGTGQPQICYPHLNFEPKTFFAIGSPIGMFVIVRGLDTLGENFSLPTCPAFFNIFHPYDPIAYRIESLIHPELGKLKPVLIPHHKGRKRMHLELKETMARVGADLKQRVIESMKSTWNSFYQFALFHKPDQTSIEEEVQKAFEEQITSKQEIEEEPVQETDDLPHGSLNRGRRIDYILQEAPFEFFNEYIFALTSHVCYWESEDTILLMLKEIYSSMGISTDNQIPQQSMTIERPPASPTIIRSNKVNLAMPTTTEIGVDPTKPIESNANLQPPPVTGFVRKT